MAKGIIKNWKVYIISDKEILGGKLVINGTRLPVGYFLGLLDQRWTEKEILENLPHFTKEAFSAVQVIKSNKEDLI